MTAPEPKPNAEQAAFWPIADDPGPDPAIVATSTPKTNPCLLVFGPGPEGKQCRTCVHLRHYQQAASWYKCRLRPKSGPAGDHRVRWPACGKYEERERQENRE